MPVLDGGVIITSWAFGGTVPPCAVIHPPALSATRLNAIEGVKTGVRKRKMGTSLMPVTI